MKMIRITPENEVSVHEYPEGDIITVYNGLCQLIGPECAIYETVKPKRLYSKLGCAAETGKCVRMLVDESGQFHGVKENSFGCWLYETDKHGAAIVGNILLVGEQWGSEGPELGGICEEEFNRIYPIIAKMIGGKAHE